MAKQLLAVSPIDGRYAQPLDILKNYFSEYSLIYYRVKVEIEYLRAFTQNVGLFDKKYKQKLDNIVNNFSLKDALRIKKIEDVCRHDIKAVEYFLREKFTKLDLDKLSSYLHIGLTSEDINNLAYGLILQISKEEIIKKELLETSTTIKKLAFQYKSMPILARTHGQPAVPTTFGKEMANYYHRLKKQIKKIEDFKFEGKLNGAVGNYNALKLIYPKIDWIKFSKKFVANLKLKPSLFSTQILFYDNWLEYFQTLSLINGILINLCQDIWNYIMLEMLSLKKEKNQIGSSTMPQKINPIDFENAEGNLQIANSYFELYCRKLIVSRLQRDLSDSTVRRTFGTSFGHSLLAWKGIIKGLGKISVNDNQTSQELDNHWEVLAEAVQTYLRSIGDDKGYEKLKDLTQGKKIDKKYYQEMLIKLKIKDKRLANLIPGEYVGLVSSLIDKLRIRNYQK